MGAPATFRAFNDPTRVRRFGVQLATLSFVCLLVVGCRPALPLGQVDGTIRMAGKPLHDVVVVFIPTGNGVGAPVRSFGQPDGTGRFQLKTEQGDAGAVVGEHVVILEDLAPYQTPRSDDGTLLQRPVERFPAVFTEPSRSPWIVTIRAGQQTVDLDVEVK